jgi:transcription antitermination factor NusG
MFDGRTSGVTLVSAEPQTSWYVLRVHSRREKWIARGLRTAGHEVCLPLTSSLRRWSDRSKNVDWPIFPGYVFCQFESRNRVPVLQTPGVLSILGIAGKAVPLEPYEVQSLQVLERATVRVDSQPFLYVGDWVAIEGGPLDGLIGILKDSRKSTRVIVSVSLLQRSVAVELDRASVRLNPVGKRGTESSLLLSRLAIREQSYCSRAGALELAAPWRGPGSRVVK